jgi:hypothetical protein
LPNLHIKINDIWVKGGPWHTKVFVQWEHVFRRARGEQPSTATSWSICWGKSTATPTRTARIGIAIAASISTTGTGFLFEALGNWEGFLILAAASAIATALLWLAMPETRPAKYLD